MDRVAIIGAGLIGLSWAELFAQNGWQVAIFDVDESAIPRDPRFQVSPTIADAVAGAAFVQENGPESLDLKRELLAEIAAAASDDTIIASSTSTILPSLLAKGNARAPQILVGHPYNPPQIMPLVEIVPGPETDEAFVARATEIYRQIGKLPVPLSREIAGFVGNRVQKAVLDEAMWLVQEGYVTPGAFDAIVQNSLGLRWASIGVLEASHLGGGPGGIRSLLTNIGPALNALELHQPSHTAEAVDTLAEAVESTYGGTETYPARVARRDRITEAVRRSVGREQFQPVLYALDGLKGSIHRVDVSTGQVTDLCTGLVEVPDGIVINGGVATFTLMGVPDSAPPGNIEHTFASRNGSIQRVALSGGVPEIVVARGTFTTGKQLTIDPATRRLYWCDREGHGVYRAEFDGRGVTPLISSEVWGPSEEEEQCVGVAIDATRGFLYWTQKGPAGASLGRIFRAELDIPVGQSAPSRSDVEVLWKDLPEPIDLAIDIENQVLYWTSRGSAKDGNTLNRAPIPRHLEDGIRPTILARGFHEAIGLAIDFGRGIAYVSDLSGTIRAIDIAHGTERTVASLAGAATGLALTWE